jgi:hypothetical protein
MKMTVKELFICAGYITADEKPKLEEREERKRGRKKGKKAERVNGRKGEGEDEKLGITAPVLPVVTTVPVVPVVPESEAPEEKETPEESTLYYTVKDVAEIYNVHTLTVYDWIRKGLLKAHHKKEKSMVFAQFDVVNIKRARGKRKRG